VEYFAYAGIQLAGAIINVGVFVACLKAWPILAGMPVVALAAGAAVALVFNYGALRWVLYRRPRFPDSRHVTPDTSNMNYSGTDNLEVMAEAVRYNAYLIGLVRACLPERNGRILDFGAGSGTFALPLHREGLPVACVEPDPGLCRLLEQHGLRATQSLPDPPDEPFALIYSLNVLEHIQDDFAALVNLRRHLAPDGTLMLYVPAFQLLYSSMDRKVGHFRRYRRAGLMQLLRRAGYEVQSARYVDSLGFLAALVYRFLGRSDGTIDRKALAAYDRWVFPLSVAVDHLSGRLFGKNLVVISRVSTR
jgi:SAM-dependent methyltransferase